MKEVQAWTALRNQRRLSLMVPACWNVFVDEKEGLAYQLGLHPPAPSGEINSASHTVRNENARTEDFVPIRIRRLTSGCAGLAWTD